MVVRNEGARRPDDARHRHACIVVARAGIAESLDNHPSTGRVQFNMPVNFPDGRQANYAVLTHLSNHRVLACA
ncbi:hypothetical protein Skr01_54400 [Sphaerisporangium krabiense]|uniref:Uncharacterized protein n=1 Tax=Sphaerisporangium krabiense TaxID=763782 RepID=A0A7W8Z4F4_9ACTN|nr:hypothetical protein [Sphaerisporangium krabiense]MBB5627197.1 hypothetical protein [Sphaerisporangium krabiense]GII65355.1 hypothetical protein Skr01_54400 [Sphaerisporangium krabiense]